MAAEPDRGHASPEPRYVFYCQRPKAPGPITCAELARVIRSRATKQRDSDSSDDDPDSDSASDAARDRFQGSADAPAGTRHGLPDPEWPGCAALWRAIDRSPWPLASEKKMSPAAAAEFAAQLAPESERWLVGDGFGQYVAALRWRGVRASFDNLVQLVAFGLGWVEMVWADPSLIQKIDDFQPVNLAELLWLEDPQA